MLIVINVWFFFYHVPHHLPLKLNSKFRLWFCCLFYLFIFPLYFVKFEKPWINLYNIVSCFWLCSYDLLSLLFCATYASCVLCQCHYQRNSAQCSNTVLGWRQISLWEFISEMLVWLCIALEQVLIPSFYVCGFACLKKSLNEVYLAVKNHGMESGWFVWWFVFYSNLGPHFDLNIIQHYHAKESLQNS